MGSSHSVDNAPAHDLILFDGVCNLCNGGVQFVVKRDKKEKFKFASIQSSVGQSYLRKFQLDQKGAYSIILIRGEKYLDKSSAALEITRHLPGLWPLLSVFKIVPKFIRDFIYDFIAKNRYRWFGKKDECMIPTPELKSRFL
jgi:predicted DCC family thiol-disulfide oxidoreductase YuxK